MAEETYKSRFTGQQVDDAVEKAQKALTEDDIVQSTGSSTKKTMSQAAISQLLQNIASDEIIDDRISIHNQSEEAHPYIRGLIQDVENIASNKATATNEKNNSQTDTYSANFINDNFAPLSFVTNSYAQRVTNSTAILVNTPPTASDSNILVSANTTNTDYDWTTPEFTFTRTLENAITLTRSNSLELSLYFLVSRNANISWGARIKVSQNNGASWTYISSNQAFGAVTYDTSVGNNISLTIPTDLVSVGATYNIGDLLAIEVFKKQADSTALTTTIHCGLTVDNAYICTYTQFNTQNVQINTSQIADGSIEKVKLSTSLQNEIANKLDKQTNVTNNVELYGFKGDEQVTKVATSTPTIGSVVLFDANSNVKTSTPVGDNDAVPLEYFEQNANAVIYNSETIFGTTDLDQDLPLQSGGEFVDEMITYINAGRTCMVKCDNKMYMVTSPVSSPIMKVVTLMKSDSGVALEFVCVTHLLSPSQFSTHYVKMPTTARSSITGTGSANELATTKAVYDYIQSLNAQGVSY